MARQPDPNPEAQDDSADRFERRSFLGASLGAGALLGLSGALPSPALARQPDSRARPAPSRREPARNLIFLVSDGMSIGTLQLADLHSRLKLGRPTRWVELLDDDRVTRSVMETSAANSHVTDSAAASCAWALGVRMNNGAMGWTPDGRTPAPILIHARQAGKSIGVVTTTRITHATPAGFCTNMPGLNRDAELQIGEQMLDRPIDLMLGGGSRFIDQSLPAHREWFDIVRSRRELLGLDATDSSRRLVGVFATGHMAFELDREETDEPSLAEMTRVALARLEQNPDGFAVQIEGGRVDHAAHFNDAGALIADQIAFDDALRVVLDFVEDRDDTLVIVTTDHGNANPGLTDYGAAGIEGFAQLMEVRRSLDWVHGRIGKDLSDENVLRAVSEATGVTLTERDLGFYLRWRRTGTPVDPFLLAHAEKHGPLGSVLANHFRTAFLSTNHTSDFVELTALGPGAERFPGWLPIDAVHGVMVEALDLPPARPV